MTEAFPATAPKLGLYPVVDSVLWIERLLAAGVRTLQLRIKDGDDRQIEAAVRDAIARQTVRRAAVYQRLLALSD